MATLIPPISFRDAEVHPGRRPLAVRSDCPNLFARLQAKFGQYVGRFLASHIGIEHDSLDWEGVRPLGEGGFGIVGLWAGKNEEGEIVKEVAVKQEHQSDRKIPKEAIIMKQLNNSRCRNILRLENYKMYSSHAKSRHYLEFCPWGSIGELLKNCREHQHHLPEAFLWHTFDGLAWSAMVMEQAIFTTLDQGTPTRHKLVHLDIKPANVLLGYKAQEAVYREYPCIKLADFGISDLTGPDDDGNPVRFFGRGTAGYMPPEHRPYTIYINGLTNDKLYLPRFKDWKVPPIQPGDKVKSRANVWSIGLVMYLLMTLKDVDEWLRDTELMDEAQYMRRGSHFIRPIEAVDGCEYSEALRDLIYDCLDPCIARRPSAGELAFATRAEMARFATSAKGSGKNSTKPPVLRHLPKCRSVLPGGNHPRPSAQPPIFNSSALPDGSAERDAQGSASFSAVARAERPSPTRRRGVKRSHPEGDALNPITIDSDGNSHAHSPPRRQKINTTGNNKGLARNIISISATESA